MCWTLITSKWPMKTVSYMVYTSSQKTSDSKKVCWLRYYSQIGIITQGLEPSLIYSPWVMIGAYCKDLLNIKATTGGYKKVAMLYESHPRSRDFHVLLLRSRRTIEAKQSTLHCLTPHMPKSAPTAGRIRLTKLGEHILIGSTRPQPWARNTTPLEGKSIAPCEGAFPSDLKWFYLGSEKKQGRGSAAGRAEGAVASGLGLAMEVRCGGGFKTPMNPSGLWLAPYICHVTHTLST
jgi:hypothetical protein